MRSEIWESSVRYQVPVQVAVMVVVVVVGGWVEEQDLWVECFPPETMTTSLKCMGKGWDVLLFPVPPDRITIHLISRGLIVRVGRALRNALHPPPEQPFVRVRPLPPVEGSTKPPVGI
jgi:hypothetical protein